MTLAFSKSQFLAALTESHTLREMVYNSLSAISAGNALDYYAEQIRTLFPNFKGDEKIAAIKWLRENLTSPNELYAFDRAGYDCYSPAFNDHKKLSLVGAKKFVDSV
jgi:hypothetical protein